MHLPTSTGLDDPGPALTPAEAAALHDRPEGVAWFAIPAPGGASVIARAHTEAHDGGQLLPGHLAASRSPDAYPIVLGRMSCFVKRNAKTKHRNKKPQAAYREIK